MLTNIAVVSYSAAALAFFFLSILLLTSWRGRLYGMMLTIACLFTAFWAAAIVYQIAWGHYLPFLTNTLEVVRNATWSAFLILLLGPFQSSGNNNSPPSVRPSVIAISVLYLIILALPFFFYGEISIQSQLTISLLSSITSSVVMAIIGVVLVEQFYRNTPVEQRWAIKFICLGIGSIFVYDFYLYSDALLFRHVNEDLWAARGGINALVVPLIAVSAVRNPQWAVGISVSRHILFYSAALFGTAIYLLVMAAAGYYLRFSGGSWGTVLQMTFLFGAMMLLVGVMFSGTIRSWLKVFISKHFFSYNYDYREEWLRLTRTLSEGRNDLGERVIQALAKLVESPGGGLWLCRETSHYEPVANWNMALINELEPVNSSFSRFLEENEWVVDLQGDNISADNKIEIDLPDWIEALSAAGLIVPLILRKKLMGFIVLLRPRSRIKLNWEMTDLLKVSGNQAASYLAQEEAAKALIVARQFESFNRMSTFMVHDLKNLIFQLSLLLSNAEKHKDNPEFQRDMVQTVDLSVHKMKRLLEKLSSGNALEKPDSLSLDTLLVEVMEGKSAFKPCPVLEVVDNELVVLANRTRIERVLGHLIQNAIEATPADGKVSVRLLKKDATAVIEIKDTGHGMSEKFINERLFKPFESTKSAGMGIGVFESREYIHELGGKLEVESEEKIGTVFRLELQLATG
ncbi:MAG: PEP-CTERM system histidine kinase PrsK [Nitrosomonas sp.]|nr:PEP-CTERM system histidine kinase PrsK [Nitrosomonas sp.]